MDQQTNQISRPLPRWLDALAILATAAAMISWTWRTWPDPLVDFGRELYVPWQINLGRHLYRDLSYFNGPLSPYFDALWMRLFGVSLDTLIVVNMVIIAGILALLYFLIDLAADRFSALVACLFFIAVFGFGRIVAIGGFNYVTPYSYEITHGIVLSLGALACLLLPRRLGIKNTMGAGLLTGLTFLTKVEVAFACIVAVGLGFCVRAAAESWNRRVKLGLVFCASGVAPVVVAFLLLCTQVPAAMAFEGTLGSLYWTTHSNVASSGLYRLGMGLDHLRSNLGYICIASALMSLGVAGAVGAGWLARRAASSHPRLFAALAFVFVLGAGLLTVRWIYWFNVIPKALPVMMILFVAIWAAVYLREWPSPGKARVVGARLTLSIFALAMLTKIFFNTRLYHYGFALAMPAMLLLIAGLLCWLPKSSYLSFTELGVVRVVSLALIAVMVSAYLVAISGRLAAQQYQVGFGSDAFIGDGRGNAEQATLKWIAQNTSPASTILVLPEGVMINYLSRRQNPTKYVNFMPPEVIMFGEERIIADFNRHPPDYVILVHKDTTEYGAPFFARDYGQKIANWVRDNYEGVALLGDPPFQEANRFGIVIMRKRVAESAAKTTK